MGGLLVNGEREETRRGGERGDLVFAWFDVGFGSWLSLKLCGLVDGISCL